MTDFRSNLIDVEADFLHETALAIKVRSHAGGKIVWLPKSALDYALDGKGGVTITLPRPMAEDKGLV